MKHQISILIIPAAAICSGCSTTGGQPLENTQIVSSSTNESACSPTEIDPEFSGESNEQWQTLVEQSAAITTKILTSAEFASQCQALKLSRTNGKSPQEVCRQFACSNKVKLKISFYNDPDTRAIAYETDGALFINTAKGDAGAGGPGNIAHEFSHTLGYTHFTNWAFWGGSSVPYRIGNLVQALAESEDQFSWINVMPPIPKDFHAIGEILVPNLDVSAVLRPNFPQGYNPDTLPMGLTPIHQIGTQPSTLTWIEARYDKIVTGSPYNNVQISSDSH